jgi:general secretion pathway protein D
MNIVSYNKKFFTAMQACLVMLCASLVVMNPADAADKNTKQTELTEKTITLNFDEADIRTVIDAVAKYTGENFIIDPRVKGKVTLISHKPMSTDEVYNVFLSVLKIHGFAAIPGKQAIKIVPDVNAKQDAISNLRRDSGGLTDELVTHIIEVKHVNATQLVPILRPLVPQRGHLAAVPSSNVIIISDTRANIARLSRIISRIDTATGGEIEVIPLQHATASELVRILNQLEAADPKGAAQKTKILADNRTNSLLISGDKSTRLNMRALIMHLDTPLDIGGNTRVVYLRNAVAKDLVPVLTGVSKNVAQSKGKGAAALGGDIVIQADENTNALVITAPPDVFRSLKSVISQLDVRRAQVLVEGIIAEVSSEQSQELGVQWAVDGREGGNAVGLVNFTLGTPITAYANLDSPPSPVGFNVGFGDFTGGTQVAALLSMLATDSNTNILSTPSLVTLDNEEAEIVVGQNVPFVTGSYANTGGGTTPTNPFTTVQREDVGLTLKIKPQINEGDAIKLDVVQEVSTLSASSVAVDVITNKRSIKTSVMVDDGQIVVLGGLIQDDLLESEQKVPGLGDIPLLGWLFRYQRTNKVKTNLMVFLHPTILKDKKTMRAITGEKYNYLRAKQMAIKEEGIQLLDDELAPVLPEMDDFIRLPPPYEESRQRLELSSPDNLQQPPADNVDSQGTASTPVAAPANATTSEQPSELDLPPFIGEENAGSLPQ